MECRSQHASEVTERPRLLETVHITVHVLSKKGDSSLLHTFRIPRIKARNMVSSGCQESDSLDQGLLGLGRNLDQERVNQCGMLIPSVQQFLGMKPPWGSCSVGLLQISVPGGVMARQELQAHMWMCRAPPASGQSQVFPRIK